MGLLTLGSSVPTFASTAMIFNSISRACAKLAAKTPLFRQGFLVLNCTDTLKIFILPLSPFYFSTYIAVVFVPAGAVEVDERVRLQGHCPLSPASAACKQRHPVA